MISLKRTNFKFLKNLPFTHKKISITFDDGYKYTNQILTTLEKYDQKATFFLCGDYIEMNQTIVKKIYTTGHEIGNHSYSHPHITTLSNTNIVSELEKTQELINNITDGHSSMLFRFPYGTNNKSIIQFIENCGYTPVHWTIDTKDWTGINATDIYNSIMYSDHLQNGAIILMHTTGEHTVEALDLIVPALLKRNYKLLTISDLFQSVPVYNHITMDTNVF